MATHSSTFAWKTPWTEESGVPSTFAGGLKELLRMPMRSQGYYGDGSGLSGLHWVWRNGRGPHKRNPVGYLCHVNASCPFPPAPLQSSFCSPSVCLGPPTVGGPHPSLPPRAEPANWSLGLGPTECILCFCKVCVCPQGKRTQVEK